MEEGPHVATTGADTHVSVPDGRRRDEAVVKGQAKVPAFEHGEDGGEAALDGDDDERGYEEVFRVVGERRARHFEVGCTIAIDVDPLLREDALEEFS